MSFVARESHVRWIENGGRDANVLLQELGLNRVRVGDECRPRSLSFAGIDIDLQVHLPTDRLQHQDRARFRVHGHEPGVKGLMTFDIGETRETLITRRDVPSDMRIEIVIHQHLNCAILGSRSPKFDQLRFRTVERIVPPIGVGDHRVLSGDQLREFPTGVTTVPVAIEEVHASTRLDPPDLPVFTGGEWREFDRGCGSRTEIDSERKVSRSTPVVSTGSEACDTSRRPSSSRRAEWDESRYALPG